MKMVFHYAAGPDLAARLLALDGLAVAVCPEADDARFAALMREAEVLWHVLKPVTAAHIAAAPELVEGAAAADPEDRRRREHDRPRRRPCPRRRRLQPARHQRAGGGGPSTGSGELGGRTVGLVGFGAVLVNTARGELVDQAALTEALRPFDKLRRPPRRRRAGRVRARPADPLLRLSNVVLTPHVGWLTAGTFERSLALAAENCRRLAAGAPLLHRVA